MLLAVAVVVLVVRIVGALLARLGQPRVVGEILAGILLGPSVLGAAMPDVAAVLFSRATLDALGVLAQFGLVLFMTTVGAEVGTAAADVRLRSVVGIGTATLVVPMALAAVAAQALHTSFGGGSDRLVFTLFLAAAMSVTALPVLARLLEETGMHGTRIGTLGVRCAAFDDVIAWLVVAAVAAYAGGHGDPVRSVAVVAVYVAVMVGPVRAVLRAIGPIPLWATVAVALLSAWVADSAGVHAAFGGFLAGIVLPRDPHWQATVRRQVDGLVAHALLPLFFVSVGLSVEIGAGWSGAAWSALLLLVGVATAGKLGGGALAARLCGEGWRDALCLGTLMNARGVTEIIVLTVGLQLGILSAQLFTVMVLMALVTTAATAPLLRWLRTGSAGAGPARDAADRIEGGHRG